MDIKYTVTATLNGDDISQEINESLFADLVAKHGPFKGLAQKIANHINENKDAMLIAQLESKRDKKLSKAQKELVAEVVALMQSGGGDNKEEQATESTQDEAQDDTQGVDDEGCKNAEDKTQAPEDSTDESTAGEEEQQGSSDDEDEDKDEVLNDALADEYGDGDDDMDALLDSLGV